MKNIVYIIISILIMQFLFGCKKVIPNEPTQKFTITFTPTISETSTITQTWKTLFFLKS